MRHPPLSKLPGLVLVACACAPSLAQQAAAPATPAAASSTPAPQFTTEEKWLRAGYNNDEIVYTIFIKNQDSRILKCNTHMQGYFFSNGKKTSIADQQSSTVFPAQQVQAGIWLDMDQQSGATYNVKCRPA